jgi:predicted small secreted protein
MKYLILVSALLLGACGTMNAAIDGTQTMVNNTLGGVGNTVADIAVAAGQDVKNAVDSGKQEKE